MSNFETQNALTVQDYNTPTAIDAFDYDEPGASPIRGASVKFDGGTFFQGKEKTLLAPERQFVVLDKASGWVFLKAGCPAEYLMHTPGTPKPERPDCGDESTWPLDLSGAPSCPWKWNWFLYLLDASSGETITFNTNSVGGRVAIDELTQQIKSMRSMKPTAMPVIELQSVQMPTTKFGKRPRPWLKIVSWRERTSRQEIDFDQAMPDYDYEADEAQMAKLRDAEPAF